MHESEDRNYKRWAVDVEYGDISEDEKNRIREESTFTSAEKIAEIKKDLAKYKKLFEENGLKPFPTEDYKKTGDAFVHGQDKFTERELVSYFANVVEVSENGSYFVKLRDFSDKVYEIESKYLDEISTDDHIRELNYYGRRGVLLMEDMKEIGRKTMAALAGVSLAEWSSYLDDITKSVPFPLSCTVSTVRESEANITTSITEYKRFAYELVFWDDE